MEKDEGLTPSEDASSAALRAQGYSVTVLSDLSVMCISESAMIQADPDRLRDAIRRRHAARWELTQPRGLSAVEAPTSADAAARHHGEFAYSRRHAESVDK